MHDTNNTSRRPRVLIVEDHDETRFFLELTLEEHYDTHTASSGPEALERVEHDDYDVFVVDIALGEHMNGVELVEALRARPELAHRPMIAVTAHIFREGRDYYLEHGFDEYLRKPFFPETLLETIDELLAAQQPRAPGRP